MSDDQVVQLANRLGKRFDNVDAKLNSHDASFERFFKYMEERFDKVDYRFEQIRRDVADVNGAIGELPVRVKTYHKEMPATNHQLDRIKEAVKQIVAETGVKLKFEL